jgi:hypothetical protein
LAIEAAMDALSHCPDKEWRPVVNHVEALRKLGMIRCDESSGFPRFFLTKDGERAIGG